jgi:hypothetical protein
MFGGQSWQARCEETHLRPLAVKQRGFKLIPRRTPQGVRRWLAATVRASLRRRGSCEANHALRADTRGGQAVVRCCDAGIVVSPGDSRSKSRASRRYRRARSTIGAERVLFGSEPRSDPVPGRRGWVWPRLQPRSGSGAGVAKRDERIRPRSLRLQRSAGRGCRPARGRKAFPSQSAATAAATSPRGIRPPITPASRFGVAMIDSPTRLPSALTGEGFPGCIDPWSCGNVAQPEASRTFAPWRWLEGPSPWR